MEGIVDVDNVAILYSNGSTFGSTVDIAKIFISFGYSYKLFGKRDA